MAYSIKYLFKFESAAGTTREIRVLKDGYSGAVIQRPLGRAPMLKKQQNGPVHGTSLEFFAECNVDREFIEFYTSNPKDYRVDLCAGSTLLWQGYITPELYSEPDIAPPYDVQVVATDGVGELKLYDYAAQGTVTLRTLLSGLLSRTGLGTDIYLISSLKPGSAGAGSLLEKTINLDYMAGQTCYEVLTYILDTLHATITWWKGAWILTRETNVTFTNGKVRYFNTAGNSALLNDSVQVLGKMYTNPAWPVGQLSTVIDPAKNKIEVQAPWHPVTCLQNPDMTSDASWTKINSASYDSTNGGYLLPFPQGGTGQIRQQISMAGLRVPMSISVRATASTSTISGQVVAPQLGVLLIYTVGNASYHLRKGSDGAPVWESGALPSGAIPAGTQVDFQQTLSIWDASRIEAEELKVENIPAFMQGGAFPAGTMTVYIIGYCATVFSAHLDVVLPKGYADILHIGNGARGEGNTVEIAIGRETADNAYYAAFLQGLLLDSGSLITSFSDANFTTGMDYLAFIARDYALSVALPRAKVTGTVFLEGSVQIPPLVFAKGGLDYWVETWGWNLYEDELEISARTLPSASLTVQSETILESNGSMVSSAGGAGSSGAGSSMGGGGGTNYWEIDGTLGTLLKPKDAYAYVSSKDGLFFTGATLSGTVVPDLYVDTVNNQRVLRSPLPLITGGDQIVIDGTPGGGGGGGGATTLAGLDDTSISNPQAGQMLAWNGTKWVNTNAPTGSITSVSLAAGASNGTLHLVVNGTAQSDVAVTGLGSMAYASSGDYVPIATAKTITATHTFSNGLNLTTSDTWQNVDRALYFSYPEIDSRLSYYNVNSSTGLTYNPATGALKAGSFVKRGGTSSQFLKADGSVDGSTYLTGITSTMVTNALGYTPANVTALADYVKLNPGAVEQTIQSSISSINKGVINLWRKGNNWSFIGFSNGDTETFLGSLGFLSSSDNSAYRRTDDSHYYKIWDAGNDGASSGLDADLLDGQHGSYYAPLSALDNYLPLTAGTSKPLTDSLYIITGDTDKCIQFSYTTSHLAGAAWRIISNGTGSGDTNYLSFQTGGSSSTATTWNNVLRLSMDNRYVGINMDAPAYSLDVNGTARVTSLKIGSATITWNSNGYLHIDQPLVTAGDQIVISGTPGGGGGGGATTLAGLDDVAITSVANGQLLQYNGSKWVNVAASSVGRIYSAGTGISISNANVISLDSSEYYSATSVRSANTVLAAPNGSNGAASFRALVAADIPSLTKSKISDFPTNVSAFINDAGYISSYVNTWRNVYTSGTSRVGTGTDTKAINFAAGTGITISYKAAGTGSGQSGSANYFNVEIGVTANTYQPLDADLTAIAALTGPSSGQAFLKRKSDNTWVLDTSTYLTSHQTLYNLVINNSAGTAQITYKPGTSGTYSLTLTKAMVGLGSVENTALSTWAGTTNITTLGTITSGTWNGSAIAWSKLSISAQNLYDTIGSTKYAPYNADGYLPLSGGTLKNANYGGQLTIWRDHASYDAVIVYRNNTGVLGLIGCRGSDGAPYYTSDSGATTINLLLHSGNYSSYALPLAGGTMTGAIAVGQYTAFGVSGSTFYLGSPAYPVNLRSNGTMQISGNTTITGSSTTPLVIDTTTTHNYVQFKTGGTYKGYVGYSANTGMFMQAGDSTYISIADGGELKKNNTYTFYHSGNSNKSDVAWACSTLTASGNISVSGNILPVGKGGSNLGSEALNFSYVYANVFHPGTGNNLWLTSPGNIYFVNGNNVAGTVLGTWTTTGLGIGVTPSYKLHVSGTAAFASGHVYFTGAQASSSTGNTTQIVFGTPSSNHICLTSNTGAFVLNPTTASTAGQVVIRVGSGTTSTFPGIIQSSGDQVVSSDLTLKTNLTPVIYSVADIAKARAVEFDWRDGRGHSMGSIAQDWLDIAPALVHGKEGNMSLAYGQLALVNTILLARQSESHEERIKELEARVAELEMENERLRMN